MKKIRIVAATIVAFIVIAAAALLMVRPQTATAGASTPRSYAVVVYDKNIPSEITVSHTWEGTKEYDRTNASMASAPRKGDSLSLNVSAYVITALVMPKGITGLTNPVIKGMEIEGQWDGTPIIITLANGTQLTLTPSGEGVALIVKEK
jgi:hypothetical protein